MPYTSHISPPIPAPYPTSTFRSPLAQVVGNASFYQFQLIKRFYQHDLLYRLQYTIWSRWWIFCTNRFFAEDLIDRYIRKTSDSKSIDEELPFDWPPIKMVVDLSTTTKKSKNLHTLLDKLTCCLFLCDISSKSWWGKCRYITDCLCSRYKEISMNATIASGWNSHYDRKSWTDSPQMGNIRIPLVNIFLILQLQSCLHSCGVLLPKPLLS